MCACSMSARKALATLGMAAPLVRYFAAYFDCTRTDSIANRRSRRDRTPLVSADARVSIAGGTGSARQAGNEMGRWRLPIRLEIADLAAFCYTRPRYACPSCATTRTSNSWHDEDAQ
jgi:hypothetical protein